jgi:hypothetical protein
VSAIFGIVNAIIGTILRIITFPLTVLTLGLFSVIVNAIVLNITDGLTSHLTIDEWAASAGAVERVYLSTMTVKGFRAGATRDLTGKRNVRARRWRASYRPRGRRDCGVCLV